MTKVVKPDELGKSDERLKEQMKKLELSPPEGRKTFIRELVDSLCRDGSGPPIVCVHWKAVLTRERSCSKPF